MSNTKTISGEITNEDWEAINESLDAVKKRLDFLVNLTMEERNMPTIGVNREPIARRIIEMGKQNETHLARSLDIDEVQKSFQLMLDLLRLDRKIKQLNEKIHETRIAVGSETYRAVRQIRDNIRTANLTQAGLDTVVEEMDSLFNRMESTDETEDPGTPDDPIPEDLNPVDRPIEE